MRLAHSIKRNTKVLSIPLVHGAVYKSTSRNASPQPLVLTLYPDPRGACAEPALASVGLRRVA